MQKQILSALGLTVLMLACAGEASALVPRTFVSKFGVDTNSCSATEPCRTFAAAIAHTQAGGEVLALDTAGYGPVTITKAISLIAPTGVHAGITSTDGVTNGITINATTGAVVVLRGLSLSGLGGLNGIQFNSGKLLRVEGVTISGFNGEGIRFSPNVTARLTVIDSVIRDNGNFGIAADAPAGQLARVTVDRTRVAGNDHGFVGDSNSRMSVRDSVSSGNGIGFWVRQATAAFNLDNCLASDNVNYGLYADGGVVRVAGTTVTENSLGLGTLNGGSILSRGNNTVEANGTNGTFTSLFAAK